MMKRISFVALALVVALAAVPYAQNSSSFGGTWKLTQADPPVPAGRGGAATSGQAAALAAARGGISGPLAGTILAQAPETITITLSGTALTVQIGSDKAVYSIDNNTRSDKEGDVSALKTRAHWEGGKLHLHYKQGMNWGRDILSLSGSTLTVVRDLESGGQSTTRTLTYAKAS